MQPAVGVSWFGLTWHALSHEGRGSVTAGEWRDQAGQILKPPFEEVTAVSIEHTRDSKTERITTTDIKIFHADSLFVTEDSAKPRKIKHDEAFSSDAMVLVFQAKDSTGKNKDGKPYRIENRIEIKHDFLPMRRLPNIAP